LKEKLQRSESAWDDKKRNYERFLKQSHMKNEQCIEFIEVAKKDTQQMVPMLDQKV